MMKTNHILLIFIMVIALSACLVGNSPALSDLESNIWVLRSDAGNPLIEGSSISLQFTDGLISGNAGCNHYGGGFTVSGKKISFSDIYATEMYCMDPAGVMDQEQSYLSALRDADHLYISDDVLTLTTSTQQTLVFGKQQVTTTSSPVPTAAIIPTGLVDDLPPTAEPTTGPPSGFKEYRDAVTGITIDIPEVWVVTRIIKGQYAIFQSYPVDKYVGGELLEPGDAKCDLNIQPPEVDMDNYMNQLKASSMVTVISEQQMYFEAREKGVRLEIDSLGRSILFITQLKQRMVVLTCFGDFSVVDQIAVTLRASD
jgi:heat shock protein HslJ